ncbi:phosphatase PAP2 family protein [Phaeodactylibacter sp.]|uniref:phosphatase PAP2 family protein n=1 Tax=Phaeodactylibacter sp. TaxID=1940289 RepID=UPI0025D0BAC6|nr:phosphatase PAP2 family protein [Phaeodactylibacter sp.]MCI4648854.1 phosphatase PAP2 family protein [Phaeodactylibacter sp.]MCI5094464.1 phosphatase PAP2 family protein [Phaeodactylibacter sp.]
MPPTSIQRLCFCIFFMVLLSPLAQSQAHQLSWPVDGGLLGTGALTYGLSIPLQKKMPGMSLDDLDLLDPLRINRLDRIATLQASEKARLASDITLRTALILPLGLLAESNSRDNFGVVSVMWLETLLITNGITRLVKIGARRSRPYTYNPLTGEELKIDPEARLSFFSGHASNTAAMSFFTAQTLVQNRPDMQNKGLVWATAATLPALTALWRVKAGKHFPSDVIVGYGIGALIGVLVPNLHR